MNSLNETIQSYQSFILVILYDRSVTLPANKFGSHSHFRLISLHVSHEVVSHTYEIILMTWGLEGLKPGLISHNLMVSGQSQVTWAEPNVSINW